MKVYCPCGKRCSGYSGNTRKCVHTATSSVIPPEFTAQSVNAQEGVLRQLLMAGAHAAAPYVAQKAGVKLTYHVWRCPACQCKVLMQESKSPTGTETQEAGKISDC